MSPFRLALASLLSVSLAASVSADQWRQFRGPNGAGHSAAKDLPVAWSGSENVAWKTALPGRGWSSPVMDETSIWLTTAEESAPDEAAKARLAKVLEDTQGLEIAGAVQMKAVQVDRRDGRVLRVVDLFRVEEPEPIHSTNSYASPTCVIDEGRVYCHFGTYGTACLDAADGRVLWTNRDLTLDHQTGPGSSPFVWRELLILNCDGTDVQFVAALDKRTGRLRWKTERSGKLPERQPFRKAFTTPLVVEQDGRELLVSAGADWCYAYEPETGREVWRASYGRLGFSNVAQPIAGHGLVFVSSCFMAPAMVAIRHDGTGDVTESHVAWTYDKQVPKIPSPILVGDALYMVSDGGVATCLDAQSGEVRWRERLKGNFVASPLFADGKLYFFNREGETFVYLPGSEPKRVAVNQLEGRVMATPAAVGKALYVRTDTHLYRLEK